MYGYETPPAGVTLESIAAELKRLVAAVTTQNGRVTKMEQWIEGHQIHSDDISRRLLSVEDRLATLAESVTPEAQRAIIREELQYASEQRDAAQWRNLKAFGWRFGAGIVTSGAALKLILDWLATA